MRRRILALLSAPALILGLAVPAMATGPVMPPAIPDTPDNRFFYGLWFSPTNPGWSPEGTIVADSGFRPQPNGLTYANYGGSLTALSLPLFFGTPDNELEPMDSTWMRSLYGDGVCQGPVASDGTCDLTPAARYWSAVLFEQVNGAGHCVGFAIVAAGLYNGQLQPDEVATTALGGNSQLLPKVQQLIARNWSTQKTWDITDLSPSGVVQALIEGLTDGNVPYTLNMRWSTPDGGAEGHQITPYAIYDKGNGLYDIAVYDNNFPFQERAVHVDTIADTWAYEVSLNPSAPATIAEGDATTKTLQLVEVSDSLAVQECPICLGGRDTNLVLFDPIPTEATNAITLQLLDLQGEGLPSDRYEVLPNLDSHNPDLSSPPTLDINPGDGYRLVVDGTNVGEDIPLTVTEAAAEGVKAVTQPGFPAGAIGVLIYDQDGAFGFGASVPTKPRMTHAFPEGVRHYTTIVYGGDEVAAENGREITVKRSGEYIAYGDSQNAGGSMTVNVTLERRGESKKFRATNVSYPAGGQLIVDYSDWRRTTQRPAFGIDTDSDGTIDVPVKMKRVGR